jgi:hypothetical protein
VNKGTSNESEVWEHVWERFLQKSKKLFKIIYLREFNGGPRRIRTPDPLIRSQVLYPAELSVREGGIRPMGKSLQGQNCKKEPTV